MPMRYSVGPLERVPRLSQLDPAQAVGRMLHERQLEVGVGARVAVPRKVLAARRNPMLLERRDNRHTQSSHRIGALRQGTIADDRVARVGMHVEHRRKIERDAHGLQLLCQRRGKARGQLLIVAPAERRHRGPFGEGRPKPRDTASFLVHTDPERHLGAERLLKLAHQLAHLFRRFDVAVEQDDAAETELPRQRSKLRQDRLAAEADDGQLSDLPVQRLWAHALTL